MNPGKKFLLWRRFNVICILFFRRKEQNLLSDISEKCGFFTWVICCVNQALKRQRQTGTKSKPPSQRSPYMYINNYPKDLGNLTAGSVLHCCSAITPQKGALNSIYDLLDISPLNRKWTYCKMTGLTRDIRRQFEGEIMALGTKLYVL